MNPAGLQLDHLVVGAASLAQGVAWCENTLGVTPGPGGVRDRQTQAGQPVDDGVNQGGLAGPTGGGHHEQLSLVDCHLAHSMFLACSPLPATRHCLDWLN